METKYYFPINSTSLAHYFGCACIMPAKYFSNKPEDIQDKLSEFLLISTHMGTQLTDCSLEIVFTKQEVEDLIDIKKGWFLYEKPLPITRVRKIFFTSKEIEQQTITNINMSTAFVPESLTEVKIFENTKTDKLEKPKDIYIKRYEDKIKLFDKYLGGIALMRLAGEEYMNYSENYFATLSLFNDNIQKDLEFSKVKIDTRYQGAFTATNGFEKVLPYLNKEIDEDDLNLIAQKEGQVIKKDKITRIIDLNNLDKWTYTVAVLNTYGVGSESKKKKIDELILSDFKSDIKQGKSEGIALCYGINRGYSVFSNKYNLNNIEKIVKFKLDSQLDYYTIESVYNYVFNNIRSNSFVYLDSWCPKQAWSKVNRKTDYKILDVIIIGKKKAKVLSKEYWTELLPTFLQSNKFNEKTLPQIYQELGEVIYFDAKRELEDDFKEKISNEQKEKEILKNELINVQKINAEIQKISTPSKSYNLINEERRAFVKEHETATYQSQNIKSIVEQVLKYKEKTQNMLKDEAKKRGIKIPKGTKQDDIIILLMTTKETELFDE